MVVTRRKLAAAAATRGVVGAMGAGWLGACASPGAAPQDGGAVAQPAHVTVMFPGGGSEDDDFKPVFEAMAKQYPNITAEWTPGGTGGYNDAYTEKLTSLFASGSGPDVFKTTQNFGSFAVSRVYR